MKAIYILLILFLLFQIHKLTTIKSWYIKNKSKFSKKFTIKTIVVGAITTAIPLLTMLWLLDQAGASLPTALSWQPDITIWLIAFTIIIFIKNAIKICLVIISKININKELKNPSRSRKK